MRSLFYLVLLVVFGFNATNAQKANKPEGEVEVENSLLWEISGKGLKGTSYLFGTIHMIDKKDFVLTESTTKSLSAAKQVAFEIDMDDMSDISKLMPMMMQAFMQDGVTLKDLLEDEEYKVVENHFKELGLPMMMLDRLKPMFLSALASPDALSIGGNPDSAQIVSYEMELMELAEEQSKPVHGLETMEFQMSMFDSIPYKAQAQMLVESIQSTGEGEDQFAEMVDLYKKQDLKGMQALIQDEDSGLAEYEELLLNKRNENWIPIMKKMMAEESTFFAVGAGHLGGANGVVHLLREEGYKLKPIKN